MSKTTSWSEYKAGSNIDAALIDAAQIELETRLRNYNLKELRAKREYTQAALSANINVSQAMISKLERGDLSSLQLSTLQKYIEALGGKMRISADFGDTSYFLM